MHQGCDDVGKSDNEDQEESAFGKSIERRFFWAFFGIEEGKQKSHHQNTADKDDERPGVEVKAKNRDAIDGHAWTDMHRDLTQSNRAAKECA